MSMGFLWLTAVLFAFAVGHADPAEAADLYGRKDALCPNHANLTALKERNVLFQLGDKFYYDSFKDENQGGLNFKLSWKEATEWCQQHGMELISTDSGTELLQLQSNMLKYAENLTTSVPDLYWTSGMKIEGPNRISQVNIGDVVRDTFRWTGTQDYVRGMDVFKATKPGDCIVLNVYYVYISSVNSSKSRIKLYARDCNRESSFICELERSDCLENSLLFI